MEGADGSVPGSEKGRSAAENQRIEAEVDGLLSGRGEQRRGMDIGSVFLAAAGIVTASRGIIYLTTSAPAAAAFEFLGPIFVTAWSWAWVIVGVGVVLVALTGYRWPRADRGAAFALLSLWWMWALLYFASALSDDSGRVVADLLTGVILSVTGVALTAGVILGLRQAQEKRLREVATQRIAYLDKCVEQLADQNAELEARVRELALPDDETEGEEGG